MKRGTMFFFVTLMLGIASGISLAAQQKPQSDRSVKVEFPRSYISLMPEGEPSDIHEFLPLHPKIVAWGADPIHSDFNDERMKQKFSAYKNIGVEYLASNVWMLTATDSYMYRNPEYQEAVCRDIEGNPIIPGWLDSEYHGVKPSWGCTNHPLYRELIIKRVLGGIRNGANMLHLDDHMGTAAAANHAGGCFCRFCMDGFTGWLKQNFTVDELRQKGISDISEFDYKQWLCSKGFGDVVSYKSALAQGRVPLREEFMSFQLYAAAEFVKELGVIAGEEAGCPVPVGINSWNLAPTQLATAHYADYFSNEVSHFNEEDLVPPFVYLLGDALGKPVFATGTGEDWIHIKNHEEPVRVQRWIATAYAFGQYFMYSWNKWGFSEETGTQWYRIPIETFEPLCSFVSKNSGLFDDFEPVHRVGILYENEVARSGNSEARSIVRELHYAHIPVGLAVSGDGWLKHPLDAFSLNRFDYLVIPEETSLSEEEKEMLADYSRTKNLINWTNIQDVKTKISVLVSLNYAEKIWILPRIKKEGGNVTELVVHLLNQDYDAENDSMNSKTDFEVFISNRLCPAAGTGKVQLFCPGGEGLFLETTVEEDGIRVTVPEIQLWGILKIE